MMDKLVLVAGATGRIGQIIVKKLFAGGMPVLAWARNSEKAAQILGDRIDIILGDLHQPYTLKLAMQGVGAVICAIGSRVPTGPDGPRYVDYEGVANLAEAAKEAGVKHFVLISSIGVTQPEHPLNRFGQILTWKLRGEQALRQSGLIYTIIRPGGLTDTPGGNMAFRFDQGDHITGIISRSDVAEICIQALRYPAARNVTFEVVTEPGSSEQDWEQLFAKLRPDQL